MVVKPMDTYNKDLEKHRGNQKCGSTAKFFVFLGQHFKLMWRSFRHGRRKDFFQGGQQRIFAGGTKIVKLLYNLPTRNYKNNLFLLKF